MKVFENEVEKNEERKAIKPALPDDVKGRYLR